MASAFETKTLQFTGGQANSTITFATTAKRAFLDTISIVGGGSSTVVVPSAPTITSIASGNGQLSVAFTPPVSNGGATITGYQYSLDGGMSWLTPSPTVATSPLVITGLVNGQSYPVRLRAVNSAGAGDPSAAVSGTPRATDYLRIVSYNITAADIATPRTGFETLVQAMSAESYNGHVDRVDLLAMQEVQSQATTSESLVARLNAIYGVGTYARGTLDGATTGSGTQGVVFNTAALQLLEEKLVGTASATGAPRQTLRYKFQPVGGDASSVFYVYNSHLKAAADSDSAARRAADVQVIRADADSLGAGASVIYVGDFNLQTSSEAAYQNYLAAGNGQAFDPLDRPGNWSGNRSFLDIFTQAPSANPPAGFATGGLDDRYDFQLVTGSVMGGGGLTYKSGSYRTFGNNGSVPLNGSLNDPASTALPGLANRSQVLDLLTTVADHLPVVADYAFLSGGQVASPAIMVSPGTLAAPLATTAGTASTAQSFSVSGTALTGSLTVTAPTGLEVSLSAAGGYAATLSLTPTAGVLASTTVHVRLAATAAAGNYDAAAITVGGGGATTQTVFTAANGNLVSPASGITLFTEDFAALTTGDSTSTGGSSTAWGGSANWSAVATAYQAGGAVRLGSSGSPGSITTKTLDLTGNGGAFTVSFDVKGWSTVEGDVTVTVTGLAPQTVTYSATLASAFETKTLQFTGGQANSTITFATTAKRAFLDNIVVSGGTPMPPTPASIAGFTWNDTDGDGAWDKPDESGAAGWTVYLDLNRDGAAGAGEPSTVTASDGSYSFTGLAAGTYTVALVAQSGWQQTSPSATAQARSMTPSTAPTVAAVDEAYAPASRQQQKRFVPDDPLYSQQWHLQNTGQQAGTAGEDARLTTAWDSARGTGVVIGVVDDGLQYTHPDLAPAYRADLSYDFNGNDADPLPGTGDDHGTAAAGVAAARGNNGVGVSGAAPGASLAGIRLISAVTSDQQEANGLTYKPQDISIYSNSWGPNDDGLTLEGPGPLTRAAMGNAVQTGRGGLGSIYVWAAGNGLDANDNSNYDGYANSRYTIAVAAVDNKGKQSWYSEPGANIFVAAPSSGGTATTDGAGITTTDRTGADGYNVSATASPGNLSDRNYTNDFGGTSSATPLVSGVVALMLEANPNLSWRDVQHVLANSARRNDPADAGWSQNGAGKWVNHKYGFGVVDATAAVNLAKTWTTVGPEVSATSGTITVGQSIPDNNATGIASSFTMGADIRVESVEIVFSATHASRGNLQVVLTSPSGTQSVLAEKHSDTGANYSGWTFSTVRDWGESSRGTWTLTVSDRTAGTTGTFGSWAMNVYGTALPALPGTQAITVTAGQAVADVNFGVQSLVPVAPVKVTGVYAKGSAWNATYLGLPSFTTVGSDALGWAMVDGANQLAAASALTWSNVDTISLQFNQPIAQPAAAALKLVLGSSLGDQVITPSAAPTLLAGGTIAQWAVPAFDSGAYVMSVLSSGISDAGGTTALDGDWTTGTSTFAQGSGDGTAGGTFNFFFNVLVADVNGSGVVNNTDTTSVRNQLFAAVSAANFRSDFNGSNSINNTDVTALRNKLFGALASYQSPTAPDAVLPSITSPSVTAVGSTTATLGGTVTSDGGEVVLERGVVLAVTGTNADPAIGGTGTTKIVATGSTGLFSVLASGLLSGTNYSFKAYVRTSKGVTYTAVGTFTTA
jgi:subtilisin-like proprotein convertase family protein/endonuclease/exonuclease/phosphatase family metal-dependent hydrolase